MRFDRAATLGFGGLLSKLVSSRHNPVAILMYHAVSSEKEHHRNAYYDLAVSPQQFEEHLRILSGPKYRVIPLREAITTRAPAPDGRIDVVITFDDGLLSVVSGALPLLQHFGFPATVYLPTGFIGTGKRLLANQPHMDWNDAVRIAQNGVSLGSHTVSHINLRSLTYAQIDEELAVSKKTIERYTGLEIFDFSCPFSFPEEDNRKVAALRTSLVKHGYRSGVTTRIGRADTGDDPYTLRRLPVNGSDDAKLFRAKLAGAYDWLGLVQLAKKRLFKHTTKGRG